MNDTSIDIGIGNVAFTDNWEVTRMHEPEIRSTDLMRFMMPFFKAYSRCTMLFRMSTLGPRIRFNKNTTFSDYDMLSRLFFDKRKKEPLMGYLNHSLCIKEKTLQKKLEGNETKPAKN